MIISSKNVLPYLISKNIVNNTFLDLDVNIKELYNISSNKVIVVENGINSFVLKQFLIKDKNIDRVISNEITGFEKFSDGKVFADIYNKILIFQYEGLVKSFSRYNFISDWDLKQFYDKLLLKINQIHTVTTLENVIPFKPNIIDSNHFKYYVKSFSSNNLFNKSLIDKLLEKEDMIKEVEKEWACVNVIHCDLKIENVIEKSNELYLIDFESIALGDKCWDFANLFYSTNRHFIPPADTRPDILVFNQSNYLISSYLGTITDQLEREKIAKKICIYALLIHVQNFLIATKSKLWDDEKIFKEYRKIILKWKWFEKHSNYSYLNQLT